MQSVESSQILQHDSLQHDSSQTHRLESSHASSHASSHVSSHVSTPNNSDESSPGYSESDSEVVFEYIETTYQLVGLIKRRSSWDDELTTWVVDITEPDQIEKISRPGLISISGLFKYENTNDIPLESRVQVEITYNNRGGCLWKQNKIIKLLTE